MSPSASLRSARLNAARRRGAGLDGRDRTSGATRARRRFHQRLRRRFAEACGSSQPRSWRTRSKTARAATTSFLIRFAAPGPRSWPRRGSGGARAAPNGNRCSSTSRSVGGRRRRVGMHSTRRAACRSIQSRRGAVANTMDGNDERDKSIGEGSPQGAEQKVPDKAIRDARGGIPRWPRPASEGISIQAGPERQSEGRQKEAAVNCDRCQSDVGKGAQCVFEG
jgi:hypothetical protein